MNIDAVRAGCYGADIRKNCDPPDSVDGGFFVSAREGEMNKAEKDLLTQIRKGGLVMVTMPETEAAGRRLVKLGLAKALGQSTFVSALPVGKISTA